MEAISASSLSSVLPNKGWIVAPLDANKSERGFVLIPSRDAISFRLMRKPAFRFAIKISSGCAPPVFPSNDFLLFDILLGIAVLFLSSYKNHLS
jgi:hypothetical protein